MDKTISDVMTELEELGLPGKAVSAIASIYTSPSYLAIIDSSDHKWVIRPRLAKKMESAGLIELHNGNGFAYTMASLTTEGSYLAEILFD